MKRVLIAKNDRFSVDGQRNVTRSSLPDQLLAAAHLHQSERGKELAGLA